MKPTAVSVLLSMLAVACSELAHPSNEEFAGRLQHQVDAIVLTGTIPSVTPRGALLGTYEAFFEDEASSTFDWFDEFSNSKACVRGTYFVFMAIGWDGSPIGQAVYCESGANKSFFAKSGPYYRDGRWRADGEMFVTLSASDLLECDPIVERATIDGTTHHRELVFMLSSREDAIWVGFDANCYSKIFRPELLGN